MKSCERFTLMRYSLAPSCSFQWFRTASVYSNLVPQTSTAACPFFLARLPINDCVNRVLFDYSLVGFFFHLYDCLVNLVNKFFSCHSSLYIRLIHGLLFTIPVVLVAPLADVRLSKTLGTLPPVCGIALSVVAEIAGVFNAWFWTFHNSFNSWSSVIVP